MKAPLLLLASALLFSACSKKKEAPAGAGSAAAPTAPAAPAPIDPAAAAPAAPAAPSAPVRVENAEKRAGDWVRALGKKDAAALAAASTLPFEVDNLPASSDGCPKVALRATTAEELTALTRCLAGDSATTDDAKRLDAPNTTVAELEDENVPERLKSKAITGQLSWVRIDIGEDDDRRIYFVGVQEKGIRYVLVEAVFQEH